MRKLGLLALVAAIALALVLPAAAFAGTPFIAASYPESNYSPGVELYVSGGQGAQSFTAQDGTLDSAKFYLYRDDSATGNAYAELHEISGTFGDDSVPTGSALAVSAPVDVATINTGSPDSPNPGLVTFNFDNTVQLAAGHHYAIVFKYLETSGSVYVQGNFGGTGNISFTDAYSNWVPYPGSLIFYVYEAPPVAPTPTPASSVWSLTLLAVLGFAVVLRRRRVALS
jgi:MYXO-CTERM domain-containing protein